MAKIRNEVLSSVRTIWQSNFSAERINIFAPFHAHPIVLTRAIYERLTFNFHCHIRIYFGIDSKGDPKVIAVPAYKLDELDTENMENTWDDIVKADCIYELYAGTVVTLENARAWITNWRTNSTNELFVSAFLFPRPNFIDIFENQGKDYALLDFGLKKEIKVMTQASDSNGVPLSSPVFGDNAMPCPPYCHKTSLLNG
jgi:hypothetical protein